MPLWKWLVIGGLVVMFAGATLLFFRGAFTVGELSGKSGAIPLRLRMGYGLIAAGAGLQAWGVLIGPD